jgi:two-component system NarL family sensor kinase
MLELKYVRSRVWIFILINTFYVWPCFAQGNLKKPNIARFDILLKKANTSLNTPKVSDSLGRIVFREAKAAKNDDYTGRGATMIFTAALKFTDVPHAMPWYDTARVYLSRSKNYLWMGYADMNLGVIQNKKYNFENAIAYLLKASRNFELAKDTGMIASSFTNISNTFHDFGNYESGKKYGRMAINMLQYMSNSTPALRWRAMCVLAINYDDNKEYDQALAVHFKNIKNADNDLFLAATYNNIGNTYQKKGDMQKADHFLQMSLQISQKSPDDYEFSTVYTNLANVNMEMGNLAQANKYINSALYYSKKSGSPEKLIDAYENAYKLANKTGNYKLANQYVLRRTSIKDSLFNADKAKIVYDLQIQYETEKKERENQQLHYQSKLREAARKRAEDDKYFAIYAFVITVVALCIIFGLVYRSTVLKNRYADEQKHNKAIFEGEQKERIRIARDLHDSIGQMLSVIKMNISSLNQRHSYDQAIEGMLTLVDETITEVRHISHDLIPEELNFGLFAALEDLCEKINLAGTTKVSINVPDNAREHQFDKSNELSIYRIVQEVLSNMVRHAHATQIDINVVQHIQNMTLFIKDNGKGFDVNNIQQSKGLGWKNIAARVNLLDGKLQILSEQLSGTQIEITIPGT